MSRTENKVCFGMFCGHRRSRPTQFFVVIFIFPKIPKQVPRGGLRGRHGLLNFKSCFIEFLKFGGICMSNSTVFTRSISSVALVCTHSVPL
jgi:hypothetical protein